MAHYTNITSSEMANFLKDRGFKPLDLNGVTEEVWGKILRPNVCLRVYTGISEGNSRDVGRDAIRCTVFTKAPDGIKKLGGDKRVHRVAGWRENLSSRIQHISRKFGKQISCPRCGGPMALRKNKANKSEFWGCVRYPVCRGTRKEEACIS